MEEKQLLENAVLIHLYTMTIITIRMTKVLISFLLKFLARSFKLIAPPELLIFQNYRIYLSTQR